MHASAEREIVDGPDVPAYKERFPKGSRVRVKARESLVAFQSTWRFHDPLSDEMLPFAGRTATVLSVGFYFGGDVLYQLDGIVGIWHEVCLEPLSEGPTPA